MEETIQNLRQKWTASSGPKISRISPYDTIVEIPSGPTLHIAYLTERSYDSESLDSDPSLHIAINNYRVGYRQATRVLRREIVPVLELITETVRATTETYSLRLDFDGGRNPFFGLYLAHLSPGIVSQFHIRLVINDPASTGTVQISESQLAINTHSWNAMQNLAAEFLAYAPQLRGRLSNGY